MKKYVAYYRVSTKKQGESGLGLAAQKDAVLNFIAPDELISDFTDVESGKNDNRPELLKAIEVCKNEGAKLVIAKLDRLSRNLTFISTLMDNKIEFVCCDMPDANNFTIHIFAALAQQERILISQRTKAGLKKSKKDKGFHNEKIRKSVLENAEINTKKARAAYSTKSKLNENNSKAFAFISKCVKLNESWSSIANQLNEAGYKTAKGKDFQTIQVQRIYKKFTQDETK